jgi:polyisoprenoid-binding protein YceI
LAHYRIVPERSWVEIHARSSLHPIESRTDGLEGYLELEILAGGRVDLSAPASGRLSLDVQRLSSGNPFEDRELRRRIDSRRFPTIDGRLTEIRETDEQGRYRVTGELTFRGVTRSVQDDMVLVANQDGAIQLVGEATFDIRDFGMDPPRVLMLKVEPEVRVAAHVTAQQETAGNGGGEEED